MRKKDQARALWNMCFNDSPEFTELYFRERYTDHNTIGISENGAMVTVMQLLSYPFNFLNRQVASAYVSGSCPDPEQRNKGLMNKLLKKSLLQLNEHKTPICTLIPANEGLFGFYHKSGFETVFYKNEVTLKSSNLPKEKEHKYSHVVETEYTPHSFEYLDKALNRFNASILHTKDDYMVVLDDLKLAKGSVFAVFEQGSQVGLAITYLDTENEQAVINELLFDNDEVRAYLLHTIENFYQVKEIRLTKSATFEDGSPFGMLRIIKADDVLQIFAEANPTWEESFILEDHIITANEGTYTIKNGEVKFTKNRLPNLGVITISDLAEILFKPLDPYMSLMLD